MKQRHDEIPYIDLKSLYTQIGDELVEVAQRVLSVARFRLRGQREGRKLRARGLE